VEPDLKAVVTRFVYDMCNGTLAYPLLEGIDYRSVLLAEPSSAEQLVATFLNLLDLNEEGQVTNADEARLRAEQYLRSYGDCDYSVEPPFQQWELELHAYNRRSLGPMP
jgi:hypothetical protein